MSRPRFLADENLRFAIVSAVRRLEPAVEIATVIELGRGGTPDPELLEFAQTNNWLLVSHDVNTLRGLAEDRIRSGAGIAGLFLSRQEGPTFPVAQDLVLIWSSSEAEEWRDRIEYLPF